MRFLQWMSLIALSVSVAVRITAAARTTSTKRTMHGRVLQVEEQQGVEEPIPVQQQREQQQPEIPRLQQEVQQQGEELEQQQQQQQQQQLQEQSQEQQQQQLQQPVPPPQGPASNTRINLVQLIPFDVTIALTSNQGINIFEVTDIVTQWINESFARQISQSPWMQGYSAYDSVILDERRAVYSAAPPASTSTTIANNNYNSNAVTSANGGGLRLRKLEKQQSHRELPERFVASYDGVSLWRHADGLIQVSPDIVERMERQTLQEDSVLLQLLQTSFATGLGSAVIDVRAFINPTVNIPADANIYNINPQVPTDANIYNINPQVIDGNVGNGGNDDLELIIVVAIVVACIAFAFLVFALFYAWRFDKQRRDSHQVRSPNQKGANPNSNSRNFDPRRSPTGTGATASDRGSPDKGDVQHHYHSNGPGVKNIDDAKSLPSEVSPEDFNASGYPGSVISEDISTSLSAYYKSGMGGTQTGNIHSYNNNAALNDGASFSSMESYGYSLDGYAPSINTYRNMNNTTTITTATMNTNSDTKNTNSEINDNETTDGDNNSSPNAQTNPETKVESASDQPSSKLPGHR